MESVETALRGIIIAWEALPGGKHHHRDVEKWMATVLWPAINKGRGALGMPIPPRNQYTKEFDLDG